MTDAIQAHAKRTNELKAEFSQLSCLPTTPFLIRVHTLIRDQNCKRPDFLFYADQLIRIAIEFAFETLPYREKKVITPTNAEFHGLELTKPICGISVMRAGEAMEMALRSTVREVKIGKILIQRDENSVNKEAKLFYSKLPESLPSYTVMLLDPMLASGSSASLALQVLLDQGVRQEDIIFVTLIAAPEGIRSILAQFPRIQLVTTFIDDRINEDKFIIPGIGDFGDKYFGT